jgi:hypothetical protein
MKITSGSLAPYERPHPASCSPGSLLQAPATYTTVHSRDGAELLSWLMCAYPSLNGQVASGPRRTDGHWRTQRRLSSLPLDAISRVYIGFRPYRVGTGERGGARRQGRRVRRGHVSMIGR